MKVFALLSFVAALIAAACYFKIPQFHYERYLIQRALKEIRTEGPPKLYPHEEEALQHTIKCNWNDQKQASMCNVASRSE